MPTLNTWRRLVGFKYSAVAGRLRVDAPVWRVVPVLCLACMVAVAAGGCKRSDDGPSGDSAAEGGDGGAKTSANDAAQLVSRGGKLVQQFSCASCHSTDGTKKAASTFAGMYGRNDGPVNKSQLRDETYLRREIKTPTQTLADGTPSSMPAYDNMDDDAISAIIAYIKSLSDQPAKPNKTEESDG